MSTHNCPSNPCPLCYPSLAQPNPNRFVESVTTNDTVVMTKETPAPFHCGCKIIKDLTGSYVDHSECQWESQQRTIEELAGQLEKLRQVNGMLHRQIAGLQANLDLQAEAAHVNGQAIAEKEKELASLRIRLEDVYVKDSVKTREINILTEENRRLLGNNANDYRERGIQFDEQRERIQSLETELASLREQLQPGTSEAIVHSMFEIAQKMGHSPVSHKHALTFFVERIAALETALRSFGFVNNGPFDVDKWECRSCHRRAEELVEIKHAKNCELQHLLHPVSTSSVPKEKS